MQTAPIAVEASRLSDSIMAWIHSSHGVAWSDRWWTQVKTRFNSYRVIFEPKQNEPA